MPQHIPTRCNKSLLCCGIFLRTCAKIARQMWKWSSAAQVPVPTVILVLVLLLTSLQTWMKMPCGSCATAPSIFFVFQNWPCHYQEPKQLNSVKTLPRCPTTRCCQLECLAKFYASPSLQMKLEDWRQKLKELSSAEGDQLIYNLLRQMNVHEDR